MVSQGSVLRLPEAWGCVSGQAVNIFHLEGHFHFCKTTQEMCIKYCFLGISERSCSRGWPHSVLMGYSLPWPWVLEGLETWWPVLLGSPLLCAVPKGMQPPPTYSVPASLLDGQNLSVSFSLSIWEWGVYPRARWVLNLHFLHSRPLPWRLTPWGRPRFCEVWSLYNCVCVCVCVCVCAHESTLKKRMQK